MAGAPSVEPAARGKLGVCHEFRNGVKIDHTPHCLILAMSPIKPQQLGSGEESSPFKEGASLRSFGDQAGERVQVVPSVGSAAIHKGLPRSGGAPGPS
jgi:hypothetical protein